MYELNDDQWPDPAQAMPRCEADTVSPAADPGFAPDESPTFSAACPYPAFEQQLF